LAPPDVGGWLIGALCIGHLSRRGWDGSAIAALLLLSTCTWGLIQRHTELERVQLENTQIAATVASMGEADGLEASWSVGVRASILAGKGPYGLAWRKPGEPWRASPPTGAIHTFPPP